MTDDGVLVIRLPKHGERTQDTFLPLKSQVGDSEWSSYVFTHSDCLNNPVVSDGKFKSSHWNVSPCLTPILRPTLTSA